ncbi:SIS domain-containing protein [Paramylibacter kogurei]|nr:SIS domain-containing protein [Amylibacter kogurei]
MTKSQTQMRREILELPVAVDRLLTHGEPEIARAADVLRDHDPAYIVSVARGSSDHVATYFKYATELLLGIPVASVGPSVASVYKRQMALKNSACISISQSGKSPDIVELARMATAAGSTSIALTNHADSPLVQVSDFTLDIHAGAELSVAATKTFVNSAVSAIWLLAKWSKDADLEKAIKNLPQALERAVQEDWSDLRKAIGTRNSLFCLGRGPSYAISNEAALKFKETCQIHAESYSSAEVLHGPVSIVDQGFPVIAMAAHDAAEPALASVADEIAQKGGVVFSTSGLVKHATPLNVVRSGHALTDPIVMIAHFYAMVEKVAAARGINPDAPRHLKKVTETV